ncbi:MAG: proprotein convertase P-domain-containing protein [Saprospiraceae bacterium]|nr:proprotein convertase P-domain-containing protein [Saprospiraceae bacterium]
MLSAQSLMAQCNIATPSGTGVNLYLGVDGNVELNSNVFIPYVSSPNCPNGNIEIWEDALATIPFVPETFTCVDENSVVDVYVTIEGPLAQSQPAVLFFVTIKDNIAPIVAWPANVTVNADPTACATVVNTLTPLAVDNCPGSFVITWTRSATTPGSGSNSANGTYNLGTTTITYSLDDLHVPGNPNATHVTTVTVVDNQAPTFTSALPTNATYSADASCQATHNWSHPSVTDNCGLMTPSTLTYRMTTTGATVSGPTNISVTGGATSMVFNKGVTTVTYSVDDDGAGPHPPVTHSFTVTVNDVTLPSFGAAPTVSTVAAVGCSAPVTIDLNSFITDNCPGTIAKSFTVTTATGVSPYALNVAQTGAIVNATFPAGVYTIVFRATDAANNVQTHTLTLSVLENTAPIAACKSFTAYVDATGNVTVNAQSLNDGSTDNCAVTVYEMLTGFNAQWVTTQNFTCANIGTYSASFRVKDAAGNTSAVCGPVTITIDDIMAPVAQCKNITVNLDQASNTLHTVLAADVNNMSYDNCTAMGGLTLGISDLFGGPFVASLDYDCLDVTTNTNPAEVVYLQVIDAEGNISNICSAQITVNDVTAPNANGAPFVATLSNATSAGSILVTPTDVSAVALSTDNCVITKYEVSRSNTGPWSTSGITYTCADLSLPNPETIYIRVTDGDGNTDIDFTTVTVQDINAPAAVCPATPINVSLDASGNATIAASLVGAASTDNCSITVYEIRKVGGFGPFGSWASSQSYTCDDYGLQTVRLRVQDGSGNPSPIGNGILCTNAINIVDNIAPVAICNSVSVALGSNGQVTIPASSVSMGSTDNCFSIIFPSCGLTREISKNGGVTYGSTALFNCTNIGTNNLIHVRITDCHGNDAICTTTVTIQDNEIPVVTAPADITIQCSASIIPTVNLSLGSATATDNCTAGTPTYTDVTTAGSCAQGRTITRTWKSTDQSGNMGTDVQIITVIDNEAPTFTAPTDKVLDCPGSYAVANQITSTFSASTGLPLTISPVLPGTYNATLNINVPSNGKIVDLNIVDLVVEHDWMGDIDIILVSPGGAQVVLVDDFGPCNNVNNLDINYDDEASGLLPCGSLNLGLSSTPLNPNSLAIFDGTNVNGTWTLRIIDNVGGDGGALVGWGLEVTYLNQPNDLTLTGNVTGTDNCDPNPTETFTDFHAYKDFIDHNFKDLKNAP